MQILGRPSHNKKLQDDVFCLTEERNYFQSKYLEQISEITAMKEELAKAKREVQKLREEVMTNSVASMSINNEAKEEDASTLTRLTYEETLERQAVNISISSSDMLAPRQEESEEEKKEDDETMEQATPKVETDFSESDTTEEEEEEDEKETLRKNAEKLLQWADYRTSQRSSMSSVASPSSSYRSSSVGVPRMIQSTSLKEDVEEEMSMVE